MNGVEAKIWLEIFMIVLTTSVITSVLTALLMMLVVRVPKVPEMPDATAGEWRTCKPWISSGEGLINLAIPHYLRQHLMRHGINTITQVGEMVYPTAGAKVIWPYGIGGKRKKTIWYAYDEYTKAHSTEEGK